VSIPVPPAPASRWTALILLSAAFLMVILDQTIVNVALPTIASDLRFSPSKLSWVVNAYLISFAGLLLLAGRLGDLVGRKPVFLAGLGLFNAASLWCGLATSQDSLITARFIQGIGAALASAVILGMIVTLFPEPAEQAKAIGVYSFVGAGGACAGLLLGGALTQAISWHWIFFVNLPVALVVAVLGARLLRADPAMGLDRGADGLGAGLITAALMLGVYTVITITDYGFASTHTLGLGFVALVLLAAFVARQATAAAPLVSLRLVRSRNLSGGNLVLAMMLAGMFANMFLGSLYLQRVLGYTPLQIGLAFLPVAVLIGGLSVGLSPRLNARFGERAVLLPSLLLIAAGLGLFTRAPVTGSYLPDVLPALMMLGTGGGLAFPALVSLAMSGASPDDSGLASGVVNTAQQVGGALGLAVLATLAASRTNDLLAQGRGAVASLAGGYNLGFSAAAAIVASAAILALLILRPTDVAPDPARDSLAHPVPSRPAVETRGADGGSFAGTVL
jgi:EmrB/QacA subfamily drug resistance transporter